MDMGGLLHAKSLQINFWWPISKQIFWDCMFEREVLLWCLWDADQADQAKTMAVCLLWHSVII